MIVAMPVRQSGIDRIVERLQILQAQHGFESLDAESFAAFADRPGLALVMFVDDPAKVPESWDLTIILPELVKGLGEPIHVGMLAPDAARKLAVRYGITLWPALLALRNGGFLGTIEGLKDWPVYARRLPELLAAETSRPPSIGIPVHNASPASHSATCH